MGKTRCSWAKSDLDKQYHDKEWGRACHDEQKLFESLVLESMQAGLSWALVLKKRENFRLAYDNFDYNICAEYSDEYLESLRENAGIIRNKLKIYSVRKNARAFKKVQEEFGSFGSYIWAFTEGKTITTNLNNSEVVDKKLLAEKISKDLKKRGFTFVGTTGIYSFMQAIGMLNAHEVSCFCYEECL